MKQFYPAGEQLRRCALNYMEQWEKKEITFDLEVADVMLCSDDALLDIVWNNLISNAVKFTPESRPGKGTVFSVMLPVEG